MTPFRISLLFIIVAIVGFASAMLLEINFSPKKVSNSFIVSFTTGQNDPPLVTEQKVTSILEGVLSSIEGVKEINSVSRYGSGYVTLAFESPDLQQKRLQITTALRQVRDQFPQEMPFPTVEIGDQEEDKEPLLIYSLSSSLPTNEIAEAARQHIIPRIGLNPGIKNIQLSTDSRAVVKLSYNMDKLKALGLSQNSIIQSIRASVLSEQVGSITKKGQAKNIFINTTPHDIQDLLQINLSKHIKIGDIATIKMDDMRPSFISRLNGENTVLIRIFSHEHENKPVLAQHLKEEIAHLSGKLPEYVALSLNYDDTEFIRKELSKITLRAGLSIGILSLLVFLIYRKLKQLLLLIGSVVVSIGITSLLLYLLKVPIHLYTIAGLTISFGLVIDNSIMVIDHIKKKKKGTIIPALMAATFTTIAALLVIFILPKEDLNGLDDFSLSISLALGASILTSLLFTPALSSVLDINKSSSKISVAMKRWLIRIRSGYFKSVLFLSNYKKTVIGLMILFFGLPVYLVPKNIEGNDFYNSVIGSDIYQETIRPISDKLLGGTLRSFYLNVFENSGYRTPEKTKLYVTASLDQGHTIEQMDDVIRRVESYLSQVGGLSSYRTNIYSGKFAQAVIEFDEDNENGSLPYILKNRLIQRALDWGGVDWNVYGVGRGFSNASGESLPSFRLQLKGYNYQDLEEIAENLASQLLTHPRIKEVNTNDRISWRDATSEQLVLNTNGKLNSDLYLSSIQNVKNASMQVVPSAYIEVNNHALPMIIEDQEAENFSIFQLMNQNALAPISQLGNLAREVKASSLVRENRQYVRMLSFEYFGSSRFGNEYLDKVLGEFTFVPGYSYEKVEWSWDSNKTKRQYSLVILILVLIFIICAVTFENLRLPLNMIIIIPLSFIGIFITFSWGGFYFDQGGYAAFILLAGIVVNATIFIVSEARSLNPKNWNTNVMKACTRKFTPIFLTIISTCLGLMPFLIEGQKEVFWFSFAIGVIGGLLFSVFVVFVIFPVLLLKQKT